MIMQRRRLMAKSLCRMRKCLELERCADQIRLLIRHDAEEAFKEGE